MTLFRTMLLLMLLAVFAGLVLGADPESHPDKRSRSAETTLMKAVEELVKVVHDAEKRKRGTGDLETRDIDWDEEDVLDGDWGNGGWGNGDTSPGYFSNVADSGDIHRPGNVQENIQIWFPGDEDSDDDSDNSDWWGV